MSQAEDTLRQWIVDNSPEIRHEVNVMADLIRELVTLERQKAGLDNPRGSLHLSLNKDKKDSTQANWIGSGRVCGRSYRASAWFEKDSLRILLYPPKRK